MLSQVPGVTQGERRRGFDWILVWAVAGLGVLGIVLVWSASRAALLQAGANPQTYAQKQLLDLVIGLVLLFTAGLLGDRVLRACAPFAYVATILGLLAVLSPLGESRQRRSGLDRVAWRVPGGTLRVRQARARADNRQDPRQRHRGAGAWHPRRRRRARLRRAGRRTRGRRAALGVTALLMVIAASLLVLSGTRLRWLVALGGAAVLAAFAAWRPHPLRPYQLHRLAAFLHPGTDPAGGPGYSATQSKIAVGSGGVLGQGLFHGQLIGGGFVPEPHTDFIFAAAGEELGFAGAVTIIALLGIIIVRALMIAARAGDRFGRLVAAGIAIWFAAQSFVNIGMALGIAPVTGLPLPFVSYGGSALFADMLAIGALQAICRRQPIARPRVSDAGAVRAGWKHSGTWTPPRC